MGSESRPQSAPPLGSVPAFSELLRRLRLAAGLTQEELAERSGVSGRSISDFERGLPHRPRPDTLALLAEALGLSPAQRAALVAAGRRPSAASAPAAPTRLRPLAADRPAALPAPPTPILDRERDLAAVGALLRDQAVRLLTLTGPAGVGKTRLALALAADLAGEWPEPAHFVPLAALSEPGLVLPAVARALGVREEPGCPPLEAVAAALGERELLLVLDNCEQVIEAAPAIAALLAACPRLTVLATSRAPLRLRGEREWTLSPLALPDPAEERDLAAVARSPAVALLVERARALRPDFALDRDNAAAVTATCVRLDGLPLAIELAAPLLRLLPPAALLERLARPLGLLAAGARDLPERQRSLRAAVAWSEALLPAPARALFARLAVFAGGATLEAIEAVCAPADADAPRQSHPPAVPDLLDSLRVLVEHSLVLPEAAHGQPRYRMLETLREYAAERLAERGEGSALRARHAAHYLALAEAAEPALRGPEQATWLARLETERANLYAAQDWAEEAGDAETALRLGAALGFFWRATGWVDEGGRLKRALERAPALGGAVPERLLARALRSAGRPEVALALCRRLGDTAGVVDALFGVGAAAWSRGDLAAAERHYREVLDQARAAGLPWEAAGALHNLAMVLHQRGRAAEAVAPAEEALAEWRRLGDAYGSARATITLGEIALRRGDLAAAQERLEEALAVSRELGAALGAATALSALGELAYAQGDDRRALARCREAVALTLAGTNTSMAVIPDALDIAARAARRAARPRWAAELLGAADAWRGRHGPPRHPIAAPAYDREAAALRAALGEAAYQAARAVGAARLPDKLLADEPAGGAGGTQT